jgi:hypothetical protein
MKGWWPGRADGLGIDFTEVDLDTFFICATTFLQIRRLHGLDEEIATKPAVFDGYMALTRSNRTGGDPASAGIAGSQQDSMSYATCGSARQRLKSDSASSGRALAGADRKQTLTKR